MMLKSITKFRGCRLPAACSGLTALMMLAGCIPQPSESISVDLKLACISARQPPYQQAADLAAVCQAVEEGRDVPALLQAALAEKTAVRPAKPRLKVVHKPLPAHAVAVGTPSSAQRDHDQLTEGEQIIEGAGPED